MEPKEEKVHIPPKVGVPQGGIVSPLLSNLILHEFDMYIEKLIEERNRINENLKKDFPNPIYKSITARISKLRNSLSNADAFS